MWTKGSFRTHRRIEIHGEKQYRSHSTLAYACNRNCFPDYTDRSADRSRTPRTRTDRRNDTRYTATRRVINPPQVTWEFPECFRRIRHNPKQSSCAESFVDLFRRTYRRLGFSSFDLALLLIGNSRTMTTRGYIVWPRYCSCSFTCHDFSNDKLL